MKKITIVICFLCTTLLIACSPSAEEISSKEKALADSIALNEASAKSSAKESPMQAVEQSPGKKNEIPSEKTEETAILKNSYNDSLYSRLNANRRLIKTANLVFKVKNVEKATLRIEQLASHYGGFTLKSDIVKTNTQSNTIRINNDSVMEVGISSISNNMVIRVPQFLLDTLLLKLADIWTDLEVRTVESEDKTIEYLSNSLRAKVHQQTASNIGNAAQKPGGKLNNIVDAQRTASEYMESAIQNQIDNMTIQDRIDYATITMRFYQDDVFFKRNIASYNIDSYHESFGSRFIDSILFGWHIILGFILFIVKGWSIILITAALFLIIFYFVKFLTRKANNKDSHA